MKLSIVAPIYNEEGNVIELHKQILTSIKSLQNANMISSFEIIFVNDGSRDRSLEIMKTLKPLKIINFRKNFGQTAALDAGIKHSAGDVIITIDGDLQNDPADFKRLLEKMDEGYDVVSGWRCDRKDKFIRKFLSKVANCLKRHFLADGVHDTGCSLKAYKRECFEEVNLRGEMHRFVPAILSWRGFSITEIKVSHRPRIAGKSKYENWKRIIKVSLDMFSLWFWRKYSARPLHILGGLGFVFFAIGLGLIFFSFMDKYLLSQDLSNTALFFLALFACLTGVILFTSGIIADIAIKTYYGSQHLKPYYIKEIIEIGEAI